MHGIAESNTSEASSLHPGAESGVGTVPKSCPPTVPHNAVSAPCQPSPAAEHSLVPNPSMRPFSAPAAHPRPKTPSMHAFLNRNFPSPIHTEDASGPPGTVNINGRIVSRQAVPTLQLPPALGLKDILSRPTAPQHYNATLRRAVKRKRPGASANEVIQEEAHSTRTLPEADVSIRGDRRTEIAKREGEGKMSSDDDFDALKPQKKPHKKEMVLDDSG